MNNLFFDSWDSLMRTGLITVMAYIILIVLLRGFGKRTLSKMNAFDMIVTIALGSTLASVMLTKNIALADGALAFLLLIALQFVITFLSVRSKTISNLVKSTPALLVYNGKMLDSMMRKERIGEDEIYALLREKGLSSIEQAAVIVLETDGTLTVVNMLPEPGNPVISELRKT